MLWESPNDSVNWGWGALILSSEGGGRGFGRSIFSVESKNQFPKNLSGFFWKVSWARASVSSWINVSWRERHTELSRRAGRGGLYSIVSRQKGHGIEKRVWHVLLPLVSTEWGIVTEQCYKIIKILKSYAAETSSAYIGPTSPQAQMAQRTLSDLNCCIGCNGLARRARAGSNAAFPVHSAIKKEQELFLKVPR